MFSIQFMKNLKHLEHPQFVDTRTIKVGAVNDVLNKLIKRFQVKDYIICRFHRQSISLNAA